MRRSKKVQEKHSCPLPSKPDIVPYLLAYTLVYQITYLLQRTDWRSDTGVMKARWDSRDFWKTARMQLPFTEMVLIRFGLAARKGLLLICRPMSSANVVASGDSYAPARPFC